MKRAIKVLLLLAVMAFAGCDSHHHGGAPACSPPQAGFVADSGGGPAQSPTTAAWGSTGQAAAGRAGSGTTDCEAGFVPAVYGQ